MKAGTSSILVRNYCRTEYDAAKTAAQKQSAIDRARKAVDQFPLSSMMAENYVDLLYAEGRHTDLINFIRNGSALGQNDPDYHALLARSYEKLGKRSLQYLHTGEMYALVGSTEAAVYQLTLAQKASDGDFYTMSEIDARLRELRQQLLIERERAKK